MKVISIFDTSVANYNLGNQIIMDAVYRHLGKIFEFDFFYKIPYMDLTSHALSHLTQSHIAIWGGTNSLCGEMEKYTQWGINSTNVASVEGKVVLMGLGWWQYQESTSSYTKKLLQQALSKEYLLSVRDQYTSDKLTALGFENIINTGCPSLWELTPEHCRDIPDGISSDTAIVTFTDYNKNQERDLKLFTTVKKYYKTVVVWPQGVGDVYYVRNILRLSDVKMLSPHLETFNNFLTQHKPDYIGTRLHGGIRALQKKCRTIILTVDNRAIEMGKNFYLPIIDISQLEERIAARFSPISIPEENILRWKRQFLHFSADNEFPIGYRKKIPQQHVPILHKLRKKISSFFTEMISKYELIF